MVHSPQPSIPVSNAPHIHHQAQPRQFGSTDFSTSIPPSTDLETISSPTSTTSPTPKFLFPLDECKTNPALCASLAEECKTNHMACSTWHHTPISSSTSLTSYIPAATAHASDFAGNDTAVYIPSPSSSTTVSTAGSDPQESSSQTGLSHGKLAGAVFVVFGFIGLFLWLLRRGTFGSGTLFGFKYGKARFEKKGAGQGPGKEQGSATQMQQKPEGYVVTPFDPSSSSTSLPPYPASASPSTSPAIPFLNATLHHAPSSSQPYSPLSPSTPLAPLPALPPHLAHPEAKRPASPAWSTSPSAFDKTYGVRPGSVSTHTTGHSSITPSLSVSVAGARYASGAPSLASTDESDPRDPRDPFNSPRDHPHAHPPSSFASPSRASSSSASSTRVSNLSQYSRGSQHPPPPYPDPFLSSRESAEEARVKLRERERAHSPAPTLGSVQSGASGMSAASAATGTSTVDGVRISSWHSSDSEETELLGPLPRRR
ncbi:hypothetical protein C8Q76DRAFT_112827 [Earliella scabrosa]|nr:hypothetical protein C8Q76DRAFT_112827 [Earliella scabrosa]